MTTKPRTRKFRIRRTGPLIEGTARPDGAAPALAPTDSQADAANRPPDAQSGGTDDIGTSPETAPLDGAPDTISDIRKEGLTGRQLRMARRMAQKHGLAPTSDHDAVRQLRAHGIDPFDRANVLELVVPETADRGETGAESDPRIQLPQTLARHQLPAARQSALAPTSHTATAREQEILEIQRDIVRRHRRKAVLLITRLAFFIFLPTLVALWYFSFVATPLYATNSEFVIQQAEAPSAGGGLGGLFSGTSFATSQDSITVQSYLTSRDAMQRLDRELGFKAHFMNPEIDPIQRLPDDATNEDAYRLYQRHVEIGYDPTEGIIKMQVVAAAPSVSAEWSRRLISYAEEQVDSLTERLRRDQMAGAHESFEEAEAKMIAAQERVLHLQEQLGVLDPMAETGGLMSQITAFETQLQEKRLQLQQLLDNPSPNQARVQGVRGDINRLQALIDDLRSQLTQAGGRGASLASVTSELRMAEVDLETRTLMMQQALQQLEMARVEANRQTRYLSMGVQPVPPDEATYPRVFENTALVFVLFAGIYLMVSLTASILRDQVAG